MKTYKEELERRLNRLIKQKEFIENEHKGNESNYTYWGGYSLGYVKGKISEIENLINDLDEREV